MLPASAEPGPSGVFRAPTNAELLAQKRRVARASVIVNVGDKTCGGSVVESTSQVLTAAHCVPDETATLEVVAGRRRIAAVVALIDRTRDTALLALEDAIAVEPLELDPALPAAGDRILFVGRPDSSKKPQLARVVRLGSCPSLPGVSDALFTSIHARPGDSGSPLVNDALRVVGVVHGGAACHIAAPVSALAQRLAADASQADPTDTDRPSDGAGSPADTSHPDDGNGKASESSDADRLPVGRYQLGPFTFEKLEKPNGFSFRFRFQLGNPE
jgi:S1-C subfamily serine protease